MQRDVKAVLDGALGGVLGTAGMSGLMLAAGKAGLMGEHPPDKIAGAALDAVGIHEPDEEAQDAVASVLHLGFGMGCGALFGLLHRRLPFRVPGALHGMFFASHHLGDELSGLAARARHHAARLRGPPRPSARHVRRPPHLRRAPRHHRRTPQPGETGSTQRAQRRRGRRGKDGKK